MATTAAPQDCQVRHNVPVAVCATTRILHRLGVRQATHQLPDQLHAILYLLLAHQVTTHGRCRTLSTFVHQAMLVPNVMRRQLYVSRASIPILAILRVYSAKQDTSVHHHTLVRELLALLDSTLLQVP